MKTDGDRAVFLDRDGVLLDLAWNAGTGTYESPLRPEDVRPRAGAAALLRGLRADGWRLLVVSNQPALAKGECTRECLEAVHRRAIEALAAEHARVDGWYYCYHHPLGVNAAFARACGCRKPEPGLLLAAAAEWRLDLRRCWMVGDRDTDAEAGRRAGCRTVLVPDRLSGAGRSDGVADERVEGLEAVLEAIRAREASASGRPGGA
ncbi:MAG: HAD family hydrolase [Planctomycetes bacterium]|nr:HAD family hydrolase [Planctomycetota bacterium]